MKKELYIIGAGGLGREVAWFVERINEAHLEWDLKGFIDDNTNLHGQKINGYDVVGGTDFLGNIDHEVWTVCAIGNSKVKRKIIEKISNYNNIKFATLIDPSSQYPSTTQINEGSIIGMRVFLSVNAYIGKHTLISMHSTVGHDVHVDDFVTVYPSVNLSGNVFVGECTEIGTGTQVIQGKNIGKESIIGAGSVVIRDIPDNCTAVGVPAKVIK